MEVAETIQSIRDMVKAARKKGKIIIPVDAGKGILKIELKDKLFCF